MDRKTITFDTFSDAEEALKNTDLEQCLYDEGAVIMEGVLLTLHGEEHHRRRAVEYGVFRRNYFDHYEKSVFPSTVSETLKPFVGKGRADLVEFGYRTTMNLTADFAGIDRPERTTEETDTLLRLVRKFGEGATLVHSTRDKDDVRGEVREALAEFEKRFSTRSVERRSQIIANGAERPRDVLTTLLTNTEKLPLSPDVLTREMAFYLQAGSHSTANSMTHAVHDLFSRAHPEDLERARTDPLFLQRCVHESMRLHPASPVAWRRSNKPQKVVDTQVSEAQRIIINLHKANRDKSIFGNDAEQYNPHRAIPEGRMPFGLTFGIGRHACLGRDLDGGVVPTASSDPGTHQLGIVTMLIRELFKLQMRPDPDNPPKEDTDTERKNWAVYPVLLNES